MHSLLKKIFPALALAAAVPSAPAFSLLGPYLTTLPNNTGWQTPALGYALPGDIGGPMFLNSFYRWNVTNITYAFDQSFINYFGTNGMNAVDDAFRILNALPAASKLDINDYPLDSKVWNPQAELAGLMDLKSHTLTMLLEQLGLADPERFAWTLYYRAAQAGVNTNYYVIQMNYDPDTYMPTSRVNGIYYSYRILESAGAGTNAAGTVADAVERPITSNDRLPYSSVAGGNLGDGYAYTGLTRDDVAGIKYLLSTNTLAIESLMPTVFQGGPPLFSGYGWIPWTGTTNAGSNFFAGSNYWTGVIGSLTNASNFFPTGIRGGGNKITFTRVSFDSLLLNSFTIRTNYYTDVMILTNKLVQQKVYRVLSAPDIVFVADHLGLISYVVGGRLVTEPVLSTRSGTADWINNDALNGRTIEGGPGVISPPGGAGGGGTNAVGTNATGSIVLTFTSDLGGLYNEAPYYLDEQWSSLGSRWASFDHTPKPPIIYPVYSQLTIEQLLDMIGAYSNYIPTTAVSPTPK